MQPNDQTPRLARVGLETLIADEAIGDLAEWHERTQSTSDVGTIRAKMISKDHAAARSAVENAENETETIAQNHRNTVTIRDRQ